jgi:hypothetical protein
MKIKITNKEIFYTTDLIWPLINYKLKFQLNKLVSENSDLDFIQEVDIDIESFIQIMRSVNSIPHGIVIDVNPILYNKLKEQIFSKAQTGDEEAIEIAKQMEQIIYDNLSMLNNKIINGKTQILN